jgi:triacylglycerol lipase
MNIILVHGILGFREELHVEYFNHVREHLDRPDRKILVPQLDSTGDIRACGEQLRSQISKAFEDGILDPAAKTHIIGHSQGGLNARFMLSPGNSNSNALNDLSPNITSLTTIASPHHGSPVADLLAGKTLDHKLAGLESILHHPDVAQDIVRALLERLGINPAALSDLETESMGQFNRECPNHDKVRYFSVGGSGRSGTPPTSFALLEFYHYIKGVTGEENDGLVSVSSGKWGESWPAWPADHADEIGHNLNNIELKPVPGFDYLSEYDAIVEKVSSL